MKFQEYCEALKPLIDRTKKLLIDEELLSETIVVRQRRITMFLGDDLIWKLDDVNTDQWSVKKYYSVTDRAWPVALGSLQTKVTMAEALHTRMVGVLVEPYMKEAVMNRLTTDADIPDNDTIIEMAFEKRMKKLAFMLPKFVARVNFNLKSPSRNYPLLINYFNRDASVSYGTGTAGIKTQWSFLCHYDEIASRVREFSDNFRKVTNLLET